MAAGRPRLRFCPIKIPRQFSGTVNKESLTAIPTVFALILFQKHWTVTCYVTWVISCDFYNPQTAINCTSHHAGGCPHCGTV